MPANTVSVDLDQLPMVVAHQSAAIQPSRLLVLRVEVAKRQDPEQRHWRLLGMDIETAESIIHELQGAVSALRSAN